MTLHQVEYFLMVAKCLNFTVAAEEAFISQSTLSNQIKKLEEELGVSLLVRGARTVRLTPAGEDFLLHARRIVSEITLSKEKMQEYTSYQRGHIRIGMIPSAGYLGIHRMLADFLRSYANVEYQFYIDNTENLLKGMREKRAMLAFVSAPYSSEFKVDFYPICKEKIALLVPAASNLAAGAPVDISEIREPFLLFNDNHYHLDALCADYGINLKIIANCNSINMVKSLVEENMGVALIGERIAQRIASERCVAVPLIQNLEHLHGLAIPRQKHLPLSTKALRDFVISNTKMDT